MRPEKSLTTLGAALVIVLLVPIFATPAWPAEYKALYRFKGDGAGDGQYSYANLIFDAAGSLYGTTSYGGTNHHGAVFKLTPNPDGSWSEQLLYSFKGVDDGSNPYAGLIFDAAGSLYGTTQTGGNLGTVFKLTPNPDGSWTESVIHSFGALDGSFPVSGLIFDAAGNLYGTTQYGGISDFGTVFKLAPNPDGSWTESVLHAFSGGDGQYPYAGLIFDAAGNLYGTTAAGGAYGLGTAFMLIPNPDGSWTEQVIFSFGRRTQTPYAGLVFDGAGNLYGTTTSNSGDSRTGTVFRLSPNPDGTWAKHTLHTFKGTDGAYPYAGLIFDNAGNLYGTTTYGGVFDEGTVFKLAPQPDGHWTFTRLHRFQAHLPRAGLVMDAAGNLYGTTPYGGQEFGVVFRITP
jgi:uncharacterized repeat protein (TIGR03803 family)